MDPKLWELLEKGDSKDEIAAIVRLGQPGIVPKGVRVVAQFGDIATIRMKRGDIPEVRAEEGVTSLKAPEPRGFGLAPDLEFDPIEPPEGLSEAEPWIYERRPSSLPETGRVVVVGIVDWGFDFAHPDFRHEDGRTRILALWDQRPSPSPKSPQPYGYGIVHTAEGINHALAAEDPYATLGYHPADADIGGRTHGTHVASIAAGNGRGCGLTGVAPEADLVFVHLSTWDRTALAKLGDSVTLLDAVHFIVRTAGKRPWVINLSMGRHGEHHDGLTPAEQGLDAALRSAPGGCLVLSCGNYFQRRIHASGQLRPAEKRTLVWEIEDADTTPNELEVWYEGRDVFNVEIRSPDGSISAQAPLGERASLTADGHDIGTLYHRASEPNTLDNHIDIILYRGGPTGPWELTLIAKDVVDGRFHCWIERDSECPPCQSRFHRKDAVPSYTTGTICNGLRTIAVGAYNPHSPERKLASFSSCGPTRDDRVKPDLIAPGESILAARSAPRDPRAQVQPWTLMSGTSMAAPHVAGTIALMFEAAKRPLRIEETRNLLLSNTERVTGPEEVLDRVGSGYLDITTAVEAARRIGSGAPQLPPSLYRNAEEDTVNRRNNITSVEPRGQELFQEVGESNKLNDLDVAPFEDTETAEGELHDDDNELASEIRDCQFSEGDGKEAYSNTEHEFESELVRFADGVISNDKAHSPGSLFSELLSKAEVIFPVRPPGAGHINPPSPAALFDAFTSDKLPGLREYCTQFFEVVALPRSRIENDLHSGDLLERRALGEGNLGHLAMLVTGEVIRVDELAAMGLRPESWRPGLYAEVIDAGPLPHRNGDKFARRLGDENGQLSHDSLILRIRHDTYNSLRPLLPTLEEQEQAGNVVDADAAEPIFVGLVRKPTAPLPDLVALNKAIQWNKKMHPKESGISLAELLARLEKYIDRSALDDLLRQANAGARTPPYGSDEATMVTLLADQFQRKTCRKPSVGDIWRLPTMGGMVAEDTLDALGFIFHLGKKTDLNLADQVNRTAANTLKKVKPGEFKDLEPGLTATTWWTYMVRPPWLGMPIKQGIHLVLLKRLRVAQKFLMGLRAYENMSPAELGKVLGLEEEHKGARPFALTKSMHTFGLGIDISFTHNPWLSNPERDTKNIDDITLRAAQFIGGKPKTQNGITPRLLHQIAVDNQDTAKIYKALSEWSNWLGSYFALANDQKRIESQLPVLNAINPDIGFLRPGERLPDAAKRWSGVIKTDFDKFATAVSRGGRDKDAVRNGFMNLPRDLVLALREYACLAWGAVDFGPTESGDVMHFDCRVDGIGRAIRIAMGRDVPTEGHRCIPAGERETTQREFEEQTTQPLRFKFKSKAIPTYKDQDSDLQSTDCSIFVPSALRNQKEIDVLVFFHGLDTCKPHFCSDPALVIKNFRLDDQVDQAARKVALVVPVVFWNKTFMGNIKSAWSAAHLNAFVEEVLNQIGNQSSVRPSLGDLFLVGHSKAYEILTPLANEFDKGVLETTKGALAELAEVWALDTTYSEASAHALVKWARKLGTVQFTLVLHSTKYPDCKFEKGKDYPPIKYWECATKGVALPKKNLNVNKVSEGHCDIPKAYVKTLLKFPRAIRGLELLDPEKDVALPTPVLHLEKVKISELPEIILTRGSSGRYEGFFVTPIHLREDQTRYVQTTQKEIEVTGRIQIEDSGKRRNYDNKKDGKEWPLGGLKGSVPVKIVKADGPIISTVPDWKIRPDGTFAFTTNIIVNGFTRSLTMYPKVDLQGGKSIAATVVVELIDLEGFLALVDPKENARPSSQSHLEFLASVRKIYQGGPTDPLSGAFDWVLYRYRNVKPLVLPGTAEDKRFKLYKDGLFADREWVDIGHVVTGIEGSPKQQPSKDQNIPVPRRPELFVTWAGDLGNALQAYIKDFWNAIDKGDPVDLNNYLLKRASHIDLIGDIDGINIGSAYDSSRSLAENLRAYYGTKSRRRYHEFIANSKDEKGKAELPLVSGKKPPQLSIQARQAIANNTRLFLVPLWITDKLYSGTDPSKRKLIDEIIKEDSPEMNTVVEYFARFLEDGLAREP